MNYYYLVFLPVTIGIGGLMAFLFGERWKKLYEKIHLAFLACSTITVYIVVRALVLGTDDYFYLFFDNLESFTILAVFPLLYLYFRTMTCDNKWHGWYWWLFAPACVLTTSNIVLGLIVGWDRILSAKLNGFSPSAAARETLAENLFVLSDVTVLNMTIEVMAVGLIGLSAHHLYKYHKKSEHYYSNLQDSCFDNMNRYLFCSILFLLVIFTVTYLMREINDSSIQVIWGFAICLSVILVVMLYNAYKITVTELSVEVIGPLQSTEPGGSSKNEVEKILGEKIAAWEGRRDKPFCKEGLTLVVLARELGVSRQMLSAYINTYKGVNFNVWINTLRVEEAKRMLRMSHNLKIGYISDICGFGTQSAFSKIFRHMVGCTPQEYRDSDV